MEWNGNGSGLQVYRWALSPGSDANATDTGCSSTPDVNSRFDPVHFEINNFSKSQDFKVSLVICHCWRHLNK